MLLRGILNGDTTTNIEPGNRKEAYLKAILEQGGGGGGGGSDLPAVTSADAGDFLRVSENGVWGKDSAEDLAKIDGYYENMAVGEAEQVLSKVGITNTAPYSFRPTGAASDVGNRKSIKKIIGGSIVWNQLIANGNFSSSSGWNANRATLLVENNKATLTMTSDSNNATYLTKTGSAVVTVSARKYFCSAFLTASANTVARFTVKGTTSNNISLNAGERTFCSAIITAGGAGSGFILYVNVGGRLSPDDTVVVENVQLIDVTRMFGGQDNISANEFKAVFAPKDYYAENAGTMLSVSTTGHKTVGFNLLDSNGEAKLVGGQATQITGTYTSIAYETLGGNAETLTPDENGIFTPMSDGILSVTGAGDDTCVHLVWGGYRDRDYEEHVENTYALDSDLTLRGVPITDASGKFWFDGDTYKPDGTVTRKYREIVIDGTTTGRKVVSDSAVVEFKPGRYYCYIPLDVYGINTSLGGGLIADDFTTKVSYANKSIYIGSNGHNLIFGDFGDELDTAAKWNAFFANHNVTVVYEVAEPTTESADSYSTNMVCDDFGTEEFIDSRTVTVPVGHETLYRANNADKLDHLPAPALTDGDYIIHQENRQMTLKATAAEIPPLPAEDGTYNLKLTVSGDTKTLEWEAQS